MNRTPTEAIQMLNSYVPQAMNNAVNNIKNTANNAFKITNNAFKNTNNVINTAINSAANNLGLPAANNSPKSKIPWVYIIIGILFITAVILLTVFYDKIMNALPSSIQNIFTSTPAESVPVPVNEVEKAPEENPNIEQLGLSSNIGASVNNILPERKEVFNIAENRYTYNDAEPLCKAMGAELATYEQVKEAWKQGADWCNYGWVKGQRAVYPTQEETWEKLQSGPEDQRGTCGVVGVNGGYFDNSDLRFGVNCYGSKPAQKEHDEQLIASGKMQPATPDVIEFNRKVSQYKSNINEIGILPFKQNSWSS
jgi:hypothetical protein